MKSRKDIREKAKLDVSLKDIPARNSQGGYVTTSGQKAILSHHSELRELDSEIESLTDQRFRYLEEITVLGSVHTGLEKNDTSVIEKLRTKISRLEDELELKLKESSSLRHSFEKRGSIIPQLSSTKPDVKHEPRKKMNWRKMFRQIGFFLAIEGFLIVIQFGSLRDHLSLLEVIYRSVSVLAIAILIVHVHKKSVDNPNRMNLVFILFSIFMFIVSIVLPPLLYDEVQVGSTEIVADPFDLSGLGQAEETSTSSWFVEKYLENTWIPAFLCVVFFLYLVYAHTLMVGKKSEESIVEEVDPSDEFAPLKVIHRRIEELRIEKVELEAEIKKVSSEPTELSFILSHLESLMKSSQECEDGLKKLRVKFKEMMSLIEKQLHVYQVEFTDFMYDENLLVREAIISPEWPGSQDIINYYKTYNL